MICEEAVLSYTAWLNKSCVIFVSATFRTPALFMVQQVVTNKNRKINYSVIVYIGLQPTQA